MGSPQKGRSRWTIQSMDVVVIGLLGGEYAAGGGRSGLARDRRRIPPSVMPVRTGRGAFQTVGSRRTRSRRRPGGFPRYGRNVNGRPLTHAMLRIRRRLPHYGQ